MCHGRATGNRGRRRPGNVSRSRTSRNRSPAICRSSVSSASPLKNARAWPRGHRRDLVERETLEPDRRRVVAQPRSHAARARHVIDHPLKLEPINKRNAPRFFDGGKQAPCTGMQSRPAARAFCSWFSAVGTASCPRICRHAAVSASRRRPIPRLSGPVQDDAPAAAVEVVKGSVQIDLLGRGRATRSSGQTSGSAPGPARRRPLPCAGSVRPSGTSTAGLAPCWMPSPWQIGHQPSALLNEKW